MNATAACLTPAGRGAIAVIRIQGTDLDPRPWPFVASTVAAPSWSPGRLIYGRWGHDAAEDVVACRVDETTFEVHCHGGTAAVARILSDLAALGISTVSAGEQRHPDPLGEIDALLIQSSTLRAADLILAQREIWSAWPARVACARRDPHSRVKLLDDIERALTFTRFARHLVEPWSVVLTGRPNVGKSSLLNALLGYERAIVTPIAGTTRDVVTGETALDGWPVRFSDTAGLRTTDETIEAAGIDRARAQLATADLVVVVLDQSEPLTTVDQELLTSFPSALVIAQKADLPAAWRLTKALPVSARTATGIPELLAAIITRLIPEVPPPGLPLPLTPSLEERLRCDRDDGVFPDPTH